MVAFPGRSKRKAESEHKPVRARKREDVARYEYLSYKELLVGSTQMTPKKAFLRSGKW